MNFTIVSAVTNMVLCVPLFFLFKHVGCALATSIAGWVNVILLAIGLRRLGFLKMPPGFGSRLLRMIHLRMDPRLHARAGASDVIQEAWLEAARAWGLKRKGW